jgi:iron uptake system EfeUOB component EfeO/EfeM
VTGKVAGPTWQSNPQLVAAVTGYSSYATTNTADLVSHTQTFCKAIDAGNMNQAEVLYRGPGLLRADRAGSRDLGQSRH